MNTVMTILTAISAINTVDDVLYNDNTVDVYTDNATTYNTVIDVLESMGAVENIEKTDNLNDTVAPDENTLYMVYTLNNVVITLQYDMM